MNDRELLAAYAVEKSEEAFRVLVERYSGLVYHAALRQTGDARASEEIAQAVFIALARKAGRLGRGAPLSAWLFRATRFAAANLARAEARRANREKEAAMLETTLAPANDESSVERVAPRLNAALERLGTKDRNALLVRFFEGKSHREIGESLGLTEEAAKKRVARALERLRTLFAKQGLLVAPAVALAALSSSAQAAPPGLVAAVLNATAPGSRVTGPVACAAKAVLKWSAQARLKLLAVRVSAAIGGVVAVAVILLAVSYAADPEPLTPEQKFARPAQVIPAMMRALQAGDPGAYADCFAFRSAADRGSRAALATLPAASARFEGALAAKFGAVATQAAFVKLPVGFEARELMVDRGPYGITASAGASEGAGGRSLSFVRVNRRWRVSRVRGKWEFEITGDWKTSIEGFFHQPGGPAFDAYCAKLVRAMNAIAEQARANEFATADEAVAAVVRQAR